MIGLIEKQLKLARIAANDINTPEKYRKIAAKDAKKMEIELDKIYAMHSKIRKYEEKICKEFDIDIPY